MTQAEKFARLNGIEWKKDFRCQKYIKLFTDVKSILEVMDKRPDGKLFYAHLMYSGDNVEATTLQDLL